MNEARGIIQDLFRRKRWIYWSDLLASAGLGFSLAAFYFQASAFSATQILCLVGASFALFRAASFIHEIAHFGRGEMVGFTIGWNLICGIPLLIPSSFYANHKDHHLSGRYGTERDGEYLPLANGSVKQFVALWIQIPLLPVYIFLRLLLGTPISFLHSRMRQWILEHMSSFIINWRHRLEIPSTASRKAWALLEIACCLRAATLLALIVVGIYDWTRLVQMYVLAMGTLGLNYVRTMAAHRYQNTGSAMTLLEQLGDSVNIVGDRVLTELFFPLGLRYHALHHLFPSLPYHNLGAAHRRLMQQLPSGSVYRETVYSSYWAVIYELFSNVRRGRSLTSQSLTLAGD